MDGNRLAYTSDELAEAMGLSDRRKIDRLRKAGLLKGIRMGRGWIYPKAEAERFLEAHLGEDLSTSEKVTIAGILHEGKTNGRN